MLSENILRNNKEHDRNDVNIIIESVMILVMSIAIAWSP